MRIWVNPLMRMRDDVEALNTAEGRRQGARHRPRHQSGPGTGRHPEMVNADLPISLMPSVTADFWARVLSDVKVRSDLALGEDVELGWALRKGTPRRRRSSTSSSRPIGRARRSATP